MIRVTVEIRAGALTYYGARITAPSIERALKLAGGEKPGYEVRLLFPIDPAVLFVPEGSERREVA